MPAGADAPIRAPLEGRLVRLRAHEPADYEPLNQLFGDPEVLKGIGAVFPQPVAGFREFVEAQRGKPESVAFAVEILEDRTPIGGCALFDIEPPHRCAVLGIWIGRPHWNRGYGTDAMQVLCSYGFRQLNLQRIELNVFASNVPAIRTYEKVGFRLEGTRRRSRFFAGQYEDSLLMGLLAEELVES